VGIVSEEQQLAIDRKPEKLRRVVRVGTTDPRPEK
jgi:hypothetical protein